jgi:uncharacterized membrane protein
VALDDGRRDVRDLSGPPAGMASEEIEGRVLVDSVAGHEDPLRLFDDGTARERVLEHAVLVEALHRDVDRGLKIPGVGADDRGECAAERGLGDVRGVSRLEPRDCGTRPVVDEPVDEVERQRVRARAADEGHVGRRPFVAVLREGHDGQVGEECLVTEPRDAGGHGLELRRLLVDDEHAPRLRGVPRGAGRFHPDGVMTAITPSSIIARSRQRAKCREEKSMASKPSLVLAFFESEGAADGAADALRGWAKSNRRVQLGAVGILAKDDEGNVKTHKLGPRQGSKGLGTGAVLGIIAAAASGGITLLEGVAVGGAGGALVGSAFHKGLGMSKEDVARIASRLDDGHAAVGVLVPANQVDGVSAELEALRGEPEVHEVSPEAMPEAAAAAPPA